MKKISYIFAAFCLLCCGSAFAICPLCTIAVGAGIGLAQWLGIDDAITGVWVGGLIVSLIGWTVNWLTKKHIRFFGRKIIVFVGYYVIIILPLYWHGIIGHALNKLWGVDKLLLGIIVGSIVFTAAAICYEQLKKRNQNKAYFPMQKVLMPVGALLVVSVIFYFLTK